MNTTTEANITVEELVRHGLLPANGIAPDTPIHIRSPKLTNGNGGYRYLGKTNLGIVVADSHHMTHNLMWQEIQELRPL